MKTFVLHGLSLSPPVRAVMILGDILGLEFDHIEPDFLGGALSKPEYAAKNPMKTIPLLEDGDFVLSDSHAIVIYLLSKYGENKIEKLYPTDHRRRAIVNQRMFFDTGILFPRMRAVTRPAFLGITSGYTDEERAQIEDAYGMLETYLQNSSYIAGDNFTLADICVGATASSLHEVIPVNAERFPKAVAWLDRIKGEKCFEKQNAPGCTLLRTIIEENWQKNKSK